jgi:hypothetical protein
MELWKSIEGYEGIYSISTLGRIESCHRGRVRMLNPAPNSDGYLNANLHKNGIRTTFKVHYLVLKTFIGDRPHGYDINHIDVDKSNNAVSNLEYVTTSENLKHAYKLGLKTNGGSSNSNAKLSESDIVAIRNAHINGESSPLQLSKKYGVTRTNIYSIIHKRLWAYVK